MRSIVISAIVISLIGFTPQIARAATYTLQQYPEGFVNVPCSAFKKTANETVDRMSARFKKIFESLK